MDSDKNECLKPLRETGAGRCGMHIGYFYSVKAMYSLRESSNFTVEKTNRHYIEPERSKFT